MMLESTYATQTKQNREKWRLLLTQWKSSELSQVAFCKKHNLDTGQFGYYKKVLSPATPAKMLPLQVAAFQESKPISQSLILYLTNEIKLEIPLACDTQALQRVFSAVRGCDVNNT